MFDDPTFIVVEGLLSEAGEFELRRGYEDAYAGLHLRDSGTADQVSVALLDKNAHVLASVSPDVRFPLVCTTRSTRPGVGLLRAALARSELAHQVQVNAKGRVLYTGNIMRKRPGLRRVKASCDDATARVSFDTDTGAEVRLVARLADGRRIRPPAERDGSAFIVDLRTLEGLGKTSFVVEATKGFRTVRAATPFIELPPARVHGWIVEPAPGIEWPSGWRGSLMANLNDSNGRRLPWSDVAWVADGKRLQDTSQVVPWESRDPGEHTIQLVLEGESGPRAVLDEVRITVLPQTAEQKEYEALVAARRAKRIAAPATVCSTPTRPVHETHGT